MIELLNFLGMSVEDSGYQAFFVSGFEQEQVGIGGDVMISDYAGGVSVVFGSNLKINAVTAFDGRQQGVNSKYKKFEGILPGGVKFGMSKDDLVELLGDFQDRNDNSSSFMGIDVFPWIKYVSGDIVMTFGFDVRGFELVKVSLMLVDG